MKTARELYPDANERDLYFSAWSYDPIIEGFGEVVLRHDDDGYQGDTFLVYRDPWRFLRIGWGSCSGCDALQACGSYEDIDKLVEDIQRSIVHFDSKEELQRYFRDKDWSMEISAPPEDFREKVQQL